VAQNLVAGVFPQKISRNPETFSRADRDALLYLQRLEVKGNHALLPIGYGSMHVLVLTGLLEQAMRLLAPALR
jgi:hypothetical protein